MLKVAVPAVAGLARFQVTSVRHSEGAHEGERPRFRPAQRDAVSADVDALAVSAARQIELARQGVADIG
jgi:hypothetical protein